MSYLITKADIAERFQLPGTAGGGIDDKRINRAISEAQNFDLKESIGYPLYFDLVNSINNENILVAYTNVLNGFQAAETVTGKNAAGAAVATGKVVSDNGTQAELSTLTGDWSLVVTLLGVTSATTATLSTVTYGKYYNLLNGEEYSDPSGYIVQFDGLAAALCYWAYARLLRINTGTVTSLGYRTKSGGGNSEAVERKKIAEDITQTVSGAQSYLNSAKKYLSDKNISFNTYPLWNVTGVTKRKGGVRMTAVDRFDSENTVQSITDKSDLFIGGNAAASGNLIGLPLFYTLVNVFIYNISALAGKRIYSVQLGSDVLDPSQYTLVGSTFTIISTAGDPIVVTAGMTVRIVYQS